MKRFGRHIAAALVMGSTAAFALIPPSVVSAHADLESAAPSPSAILETSPREIVLDFTEPVSRVERSIELFDENRRRLELNEPVSPVADRIEVRDVPILDDGLYLVVWRAQSQDGHIANGAFTFQVGVASTTVTAQDLISGVSSTSDPAGMEILRLGARIMTYLGLAAALGTLAIVAALGTRRHEREIHERDIHNRDITNRVIVFGWSAAFVGTVLQFLVQGADTSGRGWSAFVDPGAWSDVVTARLGQGLVARLGLLLLLIALLLVARRSEYASSSPRTETVPMVGMPSVTATSVIVKTWWRSSTALVGTGILVTFGATGHPSASSPAALASAVDVVHLGAVVIWLGGLFALFDRNADRDLVQAYSRVATIAMPLAIVTGVWQAWHLLDDAETLTTNDWGRALVVKSVLVVFTGAVAMVARYAVQNDHQAPVRRLVWVEVVSAVAIIAATSILVTSPPQVTAAPSVVTVALAQDDVIANVTITPGGVGPNELHVTIMTPGGALDPVDGLEIRMRDVASDVPPVTVDVEQLGPNHFLGSVAILGSGEWEFEFLVQVSPARIVRLSTTAAI